MAIDLETFKDLLGLDDDDRYDVLIQSALDMNLEEDNKLHFIGTMCHLEKVAPEIGAIVKSYSLDEYSETYELTGTETWCKAYDRLKAEVVGGEDENTFASGLATRGGIDSDFSTL